jgi:hypothetical protein
MATGKRRTRRLTAHGQAFRWRCDFNEPAERFSVGYAQCGQTWRPDSLVIRPEEGPHRLLTVTWPACLGPVVKPRLVRACLEEALRRGWLTESPVLTFPGSEVSVPA